MLPAAIRRCSVGKGDVTDARCWQPSWQFSLASLFLVVLGLSGLFGVATWSMTGAYSYTMVCALYMMVAEVASSPTKRPGAARLLALAIGYPIVNIAVFAANMQWSIFNPFFMSTAIAFAPLVAIAVGVFTVLFGQGAHPWIAMIGFVIWMFGVAFANLWIISSAAASV